MKKILFTAMLLALSNIVISAQNVDEEVTVVNGKDRSKSEKDKKVKDDKKEKTDNSKDEIKNLKKKIADLEDQIKSYRKIIASNAEEKPMSQEGNEEVETLKAIIKKMREQRVCDSTQILVQQKQLDNLEVFKKDYISSLAKSVNDQWLNKSYTEIDRANLDAALEQYNKYANTDRSIKDAADKLAILSKEFDIYSEAVSCLNRRYDKEDVENISKKANGILPKLTGIHNAEMTVVVENLDKYPIAVEYFQELISAVDESVQGGLTHKAAKPMVDATMDIKIKNINYINTNPWLKKQLELYKKELERNCIKQGNARNEIMSIIID